MQTATGINAVKDANLSKLEKAIVILCLLLIGAHFVSSFFPGARLWGINHLAYFPLPVRVLFLLIALLIFVPKINLKAQNLIDKIPQFSERIKKPILFLLTCAVAVSLFWTLRAKTHFLGDGYRLISYVDSGFPLAMRLIVHEWTQPLAVLAHVYFHEFLNLFVPVKAELIYRISSYLSGILFVFLAFLFSRDLGRDRFEKLLAFSLVMTMGSSQLFFGYVEHYSWLYVGIFAYVFFALKFLEGKTNILVPFLIFCGCAAFHFSAFCLLPSFVLLFLSVSFAKRPWTRIVLLAAVAAAITAIFLMFKQGEGPGDIFIPLFEGGYYAPHHTLFSFPHILDVLNEHLLLSPLGLILLITLLILLKSDVWAKDRVVTFLILVSGFQLLYSFLIDAKLGAPRDWDVFSATALGYTVLAIYLFNKRTKAMSNFRYISLILISTALFSTLPWVLLNASTDKSIERFRAVLELDPKRSRQGHYLLAQYFGEHGMAEEFAEEQRTERELFPELIWVNSAISFIDNGKIDDAIALLNQAIERNPDYAAAYYNLGVAYTHKGLLGEASQLINRAIAIFPYKAAYYEGLGSVYHMMGRLDESIQSYKKAKKLNPENPSLCYYQLGTLYSEKGLLDEAVLSYERALALEPDFFKARHNAGVAYLSLGRTDQAIGSFEKALKIQPDNARAHYGLGIALMKKGLGQKAREHLKRYLELSTDTSDHWRVRGLLDHLKSE